MPRSVIFATILVALLLTGCSSTGSPIETTEAAQPSRTASPSPTPVVDDMEACRQLSALLIPTQDIVSAIVADPSGATIDKAQLTQTAEELRAVDEVASSKMRVYLAPFSSVVLIIDDVWNARIDPPDSLDTGAYRDAAINILTYCVETVGYRAS